MISVQVPIFTVSMSPDSISSYSLDRPIPVSRSGLRYAHRYRLDLARELSALLLASERLEETICLFITRFQSGGAWQALRKAK